MDIIKIGDELVEVNTILNSTDIKLEQHGSMRKDTKQTWNECVEILGKLYMLQIEY